MPTDAEPHNARETVTWAGLDVGTNSVKLLVARVHFDGASPRVETLLHDIQVTRMGEGLNASGALHDAPMQRAVEAIAALARKARDFAPAGISALGMEAFRRAANGPAFARRVADETGVPLRILKGQEEADLGREGVLLGFGEALPAKVLVMDVGGGSSELALTEPRWEISVPRGAVTTTEQFLSSDPPTAEEMAAMRAVLDEVFREAWRGSSVNGPLPIVAVGGTVTSYAAMQAEMETFDESRIHRMTLTLENIVAWTDRLAAMPLEVRRRVSGLNPARAPVIVGGGAILEAILRAVGADALRVSVANLLHAHVAHEAAHWRREAGIHA